MKQFTRLLCLFLLGQLSFVSAAADFQGLAAPCGYAPVTIWEPDGNGDPLKMQVPYLSGACYIVQVEYEGIGWMYVKDSLQCLGPTDENGNAWSEKIFFTLTQKPQDTRTIVNWAVGVVAPIPAPPPFLRASLDACENPA